jgi:hypothetical protein
VERDIHVTRAYLEAIEEEHFDVLPAPVYTRGFVRLYARRAHLRDAERGGLRLPSLPARTARADDGAAGTPALSADVRRWALAGVGVVVLILSAVFLPRAFEGAGSSATATPTSVAATAQATVQACRCCSRRPRRAATQHPPRAQSPCRTSWVWRARTRRRGCRMPG